MSFPFCIYSWFVLIWKFPVLPLQSHWSEAEHDCIITVYWVHNVINMLCRSKRNWVKGEKWLIRMNRSITKSIPCLYHVVMFWMSVVGMRKSSAVVCHKDSQLRPHRIYFRIWTKYQWQRKIPNGSDRLSVTPVLNSSYWVSYKSSPGIVKYTIVFIMCAMKLSLRRGF